MKTCCKCKCSKDLSLFYRNKSTKDGLSYECKECVKSAQAEYYEKNREVLRERNTNFIKRQSDAYISALKQKAKERNHKNGYSRKQWEKTKSDEFLLIKKRERDKAYRKKKKNSEGPKMGPKKPRSDKLPEDLRLIRKKERAKKHAINLPDSVIVNRIIYRRNIKRDVVNADLIDAYRSLVLIKRSLKNEKRQGNAARAF